MLKLQRMQAEVRACMRGRCMVREDGRGAVHVRGWGFRVRVGG